MSFNLTFPEPDQCCDGIPRKRRAAFSSEGNTTLNLLPSNLFDITILYPQSDPSFWALYRAYYRTDIPLTHIDDLPNPPQEDTI